MFFYARSFNQPLYMWNVLKVTNMNDAFENTPMTEANKPSKKNYQKYLHHKENIKPSIEAASMALLSKKGLNKDVSKRVFEMLTNDPAMSENLAKHSIRASRKFETLKFRKELKEAIQKMNSRKSHTKSSKSTSKSASKGGKRTINRRTKTRKTR